MSELSTSIKLTGGAAIPRFGFGTFKIEDGDSQAAVETALETGYRLVDTATGYGNEVGVGRALAASGLGRDEVFLTSKVWDHGYDDVRKGLEQSLERLGTPYLDLYLLHWPRPGVGKYVESWQALLDARAASSAPPASPTSRSSTSKRSRPRPAPRPRSTRSSSTRTSASPNCAPTTPSTSSRPSRGARWR
jgi:hypothetical protein